MIGQREREIHRKRDAIRIGGPPCDSLRAIKDARAGDQVSRYEAEQGVGPAADAPFFGGYLQSVMVCMAVSASPCVGYLPSILYFFVSFGFVAIVTHFFVVMSSMT